MSETGLDKIVTVVGATSHVEAAISADDFLLNRLPCGIDLFATRDDTGFSARHSG